MKQPIVTVSASNSIPLRAARRSTSGIPSTAPTTAALSNPYVVGGPGAATPGTDTASRIPTRATSNLNLRKGLGPRSQSARVDSILTATLPVQSAIVPSPLSARGVPHTLVSPVSATSATSSGSRRAVLTQPIMEREGSVRSLLKAASSEALLSPVIASTAQLQAPTSLPVVPRLPSSPIVTPRKPVHHDVSRTVPPKSPVLTPRAPASARSLTKQGGNSQLRSPHLKAATQANSSQPRPPSGGILHSPSRTLKRTDSALPGPLQTEKAPPSPKQAVTAVTPKAQPKSLLRRDEVPVKQKIDIVQRDAAARKSDAGTSKPKLRAGSVPPPERPGSKQGRDAAALKSPVVAPPVSVLPTAAVPSHDHAVVHGKTSAKAPAVKRPLSPTSAARAERMEARK